MNILFTLFPCRSFCEEVKGKYFKILVITKIRGAYALLTRTKHPRKESLNTKRQADGDFNVKEECKDFKVSHLRENHSLMVSTLNANGMKVGINICK